MIWHLHGPRVGFPQVLQFPPTVGPNVSLHLQMMTLRLNMYNNYVSSLISWLSLGFMSLNLNIPFSKCFYARCIFGQSSYRTVAMTSM